MKAASCTAPRATVAITVRQHAFKPQNETALQANKKPYSPTPQAGVGLPVGLTGFEPATSCSQSRRATKLRYSPMCRTKHKFIL